MSRGRVVRFPAASELRAAPGPVPVLGPVVFTLRFGGVSHPVDFTDLPCPRLVRALATALATIGGDDGSVRTLSPDFRQMERHLRTFVDFASRWAARAGPPAVPVELFALGEVCPDLLDAFEAELLARFGPTGKRVGSFMATVVRLLRCAGEADPAAFSAPMAARLGYVSSAAHHVGVPLDAYPMPVLDAVRAAALADVGAIRDRIDAGWRLTATGSDPALAGWSARQNALWHLARHGPLPPAQFRHLHHLRCAPGGISALNGELFLTPADLAPALVALICLTGLEPDCAKSLRSDCLSSPARGFVTLSYQKNRAHTRTAKSMRVRDGGLATPGGLLRLLVRLTEGARSLAVLDALWVGADVTRLRAFFRTDYEMTHALRRWAARHQLDQLADRDGTGVRLDLRRLRKTVKSAAYLRSGGVLDDFVTGHTKAVAAARYADIDAHREIHEQAVEAGLRQALEVALPPPVVATGAGVALPTPGGVTTALSSAQAAAAASATGDVFLASCTDFHRSPFARQVGEGCPTAVWGCLECPNAVFTERHLPSLIDFARFLADQRGELSATQWAARYALAHERLTTGVLAAFTTAELEQARQRGEPGGASAIPARLLAGLT